MNKYTRLFIKIAYGFYAYWQNSIKAMLNKKENDRKIYKKCKENKKKIYKKTEK